MGMEEGGDSMQPPQTPRRTIGSTLFGLGLLTSFIQPIFLLFIGKDVNDAIWPHAYRALQATMLLREHLTLMLFFALLLFFASMVSVHSQIMLFFFPGDYFPGSQYCIFFSMCFTSEVPSCCFQRRMESFCLVSSSSLAVFRGCPSEDQKPRC